MKCQNGCGNEAAFLVRGTAVGDVYMCEPCGQAFMLGQNSGEEATATEIGSLSQITRRVETGVALTDGTWHIHKTHLPVEYYDSVAINLGKEAALAYYEERWPEMTVAFIGPYAIQSVEQAMEENDVDS